MNERTWNNHHDNDSIKGTIERIVFTAPDSNYIVFRVMDETNDMSQTVTGYGEKPLVGDRLEIHGHWVEHRRFGRQFAASSWTRLYPDTVDGMERFLSSAPSKALARPLPDALSAPLERIRWTSSPRIRNSFCLLKE